MEVQTELPGPPLDEDIPCSQCGYDLRGLSLSGRCPECGSEILPSYALWQIALRGLRGADSRWLSSVYRGLRLILLSNFLLMALAFVPDHVFADEFGGGRLALLVYSVCMWVLAHWGVWKLSVRNRDDHTFRASRAWRIVIKLCVWISVLAPGWFYAAASARRSYYDMNLNPRIEIPGWTQDVGYWSVFAGIICIFHCWDVLNRCAAYEGTSWRLWIGRVLQWFVPAGLCALYISEAGYLFPQQSLEGLLLFPFPVLGVVLVPIQIVDIFREIILDVWRVRVFRMDDSLIILGLLISSSVCIVAVTTGFLRVHRALAGSTTEPSKAG